MRALRLAVIVFCAVIFLVAATRRRSVHQANWKLDANRSFVVTDQAILDGFSFERVLTTLVERSGVPNVTPTSLYQQWFDTQNPKPGLAAANGAPHCDDYLVDGKPSFNGFPRHCPTPEGALAKTLPFVPAQYRPVALINRFDLTPVDGSSCGQYRIIFVRTAGLLRTDRIRVIFEATLPNPQPSRGLEGCRGVATFWAGLSHTDSVAERRARLEEFFFTGVPGFAPAIHPTHFSRAGGGDIRTLHFPLGYPVLPRFYQFRLETSPSAVVMQPDVLENFPLAQLFDGHNTSPQAKRFRDEFVAQVRTLAIANVNRFFMKISPEFLAAESEPPDHALAYNYSFAFLAGLITPEGRTFANRIQEELDRAGSPMTAASIIFRAQSQNCTGCHSDANWLSFAHVDESATETGDGGPRFATSKVMRDVFIPHRMSVLRTFLTFGSLPKDLLATSGQTIGGGRVVQ